jgi:outer membrane lipoprotein carrier protein
MLRFFQTLLFLLVSLPAMAIADTADQLSERLQSHARLSAAFQQYTLGDDNFKSENASGRLWIEGVDRFRWETESPFPQTIISDGQWLWVYDPDLEQATQRPLGEGEVMTPARVLGGDVEQLNRYFNVKQIEAGAGNSLFELTPKEEGSAEFQSLRLLFSGDLLAELLIQDGLGQRSLIMLSEQSFPAAFDQTMFRFVPPTSVDVIVMDQNG